MTEAGVRLCHRACGAIAAVTVPGVGSWPKAWELTADAHDAFLEAVAKYEASREAGGYDSMRGSYANVRGAFDEFVAAWKRATTLWREERRC